MRKASTMNTIYTFLIIGALHGTTEARIYQTADAIITEAEDFSGGLKGRSIDNDDDMSWIPSASLSISKPVLDELVKPIRALPSGTFLLTDRTCWTPDGKLGTCNSIRTCNPNIKLPSLNFVDSSKLGAQGTCAFFKSEGTLVYGVCCPVRQAPPFIGFGSPFLASGSPWWSTLFPFGTSMASAGTTTSKPSTTSPWWVPDSTTTTTRPSTTSPWWVPDPTTSTTTPSPASTSTRKPSTTSPWWVPEGTTTTTATTTTATTTTATTTTATTTTATTTTATTTTATTTTTPKPIGVPSTAPVVIDSSPGNIKASCGAGPHKTLSADEQKRIVGGTTATRNSWPFVVALFSNLPGKNPRHFCGGSLIDSTHILTAAHCIAHMSSTDVSRLEVALAMHTLKPYDSQALRKRVRRVVRHKGFNPVTLYNDVAVLTLASPVTFSRSISPVCLPPIDSTEQFTSKESTVVGWGALKEGGIQPDVLQQVTVQIQSNAECTKNYGKDAPGGIVEHMICAAYPGKDSCSGDSGGPMVTQASPGSPWIQAGIVSWGIGCGKAPYPGVYSRVTSFSDWIHKNLQ